MIDLLREQPLLLLFLVAAIGYPLGNIPLGGGKLGVAAVLFAGLAVGALHPDLKVPELIYQLGLVLFVYTVGLNSGRGFFLSFRRSGLRDNFFILFMLLSAGFLALGIHWVIGLAPTYMAGMFAGSLTNTPALAAVLEYVKNSMPEAAREQALAEPVIGYSIAYPIGVVGMLMAIAIMQRIWRIDYAEEARRSHENVGVANLVNRTIRILREEDLPLRGMDRQLDIVFGRIKRSDLLFLPNGDTVLRKGDLVTVIGSADDVERAVLELGEVTDENLDLDRSKIDYRRIFVSNPRIAGRRLRDLNLPKQFGATVTRIRRGDIELVPHGDTVLELGDRVRIVTHRDRMPLVSAFLGDSYRRLSEVDILSFGSGIALGVLLGLVPIPFPGGITLKLGMAGGPLIVALILGALERTGPLVWNLPYSANMTLRQIGLVMFLAGVGTRAGYAFLSVFSQSSGLIIFLSGAFITCTIAILTLVIGYKILRIPMGKLIGMLAGLQTQPAVLGFALEQTKNDLPNIGYACVYPAAMIGKIILAQVILAIALSMAK